MEHKENILDTIPDKKHNNNVKDQESQEGNIAKLCEFTKCQNPNQEGMRLLPFSSSTIIITVHA